MEVITDNALAPSSRSERALKKQRYSLVSIRQRNAGLPPGIVAAKACKKNVSRVIARCEHDRLSLGIIRHLDVRTEIEVASVAPLTREHVQQAQAGPLCLLSAINELLHVRAELIFVL
jgi:hypothetical protein